MHSAAYAALGLDAAYLAFEVPPPALGSAIAGARALGVRQLSISLPHKVAVMEHLDEIEETARRIGAVNTVVRRDGRLVGTNTDWLGAARALERETPLADARAVVLGAGGTARAVT
jgi:shikimate dehydrogenase